jgi:hypothetical protein
VAGEGDDQINGAVGSGLSEVMERASAHGEAAGTATAARTKARRPVAAAPLDARWRQILNTRYALGDIRDILPWTIHRLVS